MKSVFTLYTENSLTQGACQLVLDIALIEIARFPQVHMVKRGPIKQEENLMNNFEHPLDDLADCQSVGTGTANSFTVDHKYRKE